MSNAQLRRSASMNADRKLSPRPMDPEEIRFRSALINAISQRFPDLRISSGTSAISANGLAYEGSVVEIYLETPETLSLYITVPNDVDTAKELVEMENDFEYGVVTEGAIKDELKNMAVETARNLKMGLNYSVSHVEVERKTTTVILTADDDLPSIDEFKAIISRLEYPHGLVVR